MWRVNILPADRFPLFPHSLITRVEAAEGGTVPTGVAMRREDVSRKDPQEAAAGRRARGTRPVVTALAQAPYLTIANI